MKALEQPSLFKPPRARGPKLGRQIDLHELMYPLIDRAIVGDPVTLLSVSKRWVVARCAADTTVMLGCLSCRQQLANLTQLLWHLEAAPNQTHTLARCCGEHGWETL